MKHQQYDLTNVLHRPVETAVDSWHLALKSEFFSQTAKYGQ